VQYVFLWASGAPNSRAAPGSLHTSYATECTSQGVQKFLLKTKYNKGVTRTDDCLVTCHSIMLTVVRFLQLSFLSGRKLDTGYGTFCPSKQKTGYAGC